MKRIQKETIKHYDRMIGWAEKQEPEGEIDMEKMSQEIGETWGWMDCPYCENYEDCDDGCPLDSKEECCNGIYGKMAYSYTWKTWLKYAKQVREYIVVNG